MFNYYKTIILIFIILVILFGCAKEQSPSRDHIPLVKEKLTRLQDGVRNKNRAAIDSVLSVGILDNNQSSDSLLNFIYGGRDDFGFERFGEPVIIYTEKVAKVECYVMDTSMQKNRPLTLTFGYDNGLWLLTRFDATIVNPDS